MGQATNCIPHVKSQHKCKLAAMYISFIQLHGIEIYFLRLRATQNMGLSDFSAAVLAVIGLAYICIVW